MEIYKQIAFRRSFSILHWIHHLVILAALPWYYKYFKARCHSRSCLSTQQASLSHSLTCGSITWGQAALKKSSQMCYGSSEA